MIADILLSQAAGDGEEFGIKSSAPQSPTKLKSKLGKFEKNKMGNVVDLPTQPDCLLLPFTRSLLVIPDHFATLEPPWGVRTTLRLLEPRSAYLIISSP